MGAVPLPVWDGLILMAPIFVVLAIWAFRLDERLAAPEHSQRPRRCFCGMDGQGRMLLFDPDGTLWPENPARQIEATLAGSRRRS